MYRVLYVGDHHRDEEAAAEVGALFVQARVLKEIEPSTNDDTLYFEDYEMLANAVPKAEGRMVVHDFLNRGHGTSA